MVKLLKGMRSVPVIVDGTEEEYLGRRGRPGGGRTSTMITPLKGLRSVPKIQKKSNQ